MMIFNDIGYIIHSRPYRESSLLLKLFSREYGLFSAVQNGARRNKRIAAQPFYLLQVSWSGKSDLKNVKSLEAIESRALFGKNLYVGLYLNELLDRLLPEFQGIQAIFERYHHLILKLASIGTDIEPLLRSFEYSLLDELGYGFSLDRDTNSGAPITTTQYYRFDPRQGLLLNLSGDVRGTSLYKGEYLLSIAAMDYSQPEVRLVAKRLMREALAPHIGSKPLMSRELYRGQIIQPEVLR